MNNFDEKNAQRYRDMMNPKEFVSLINMHRIMNKGNDDESFSIICNVDLQTVKIQCLKTWNVIFEVSGIKQQTIKHKKVKTWKEELLRGVTKNG